MPAFNTYAAVAAGAPGTPDTSADPYALTADVHGGVSLSRNAFPPRLAAVLLASTATLAALKLLGWRFNVGVTS